MCVRERERERGGGMRGLERQREERLIHLVFRNRQFKFFLLNIIQLYRGKEVTNDII